jgi:hypothetical protein
MKTLEETGTRKRRSAVFLLILLSHGLFIEALIRKGKEIKLTRPELSEALRVYLLPQKVLPVSDAPKPESPLKVPLEGSVLNRETSPGLAPTVPTAPSIETPPVAPQIDWQGESDLAAKNRASEAEKDNSYRDLSKSMSPAQLDWLKRNHMEPASPGITWKRPRVEVTKDGLPIVHINDHCVLLPILLIPMVFCSIGHIEPNGDLFKHMHDPPLQ